MVKPPSFIKSERFLKGELVLAITMIVVVFSFSADLVLAAETKISSQDVERIKIALDVVKTISGFGGVLVDGGVLMKALNTVIRGGQTATDITYGLLVLSAINEMEFIDLVLSQDYKDIAREYFNKVLDERVNLRSYWKGVGFDIPRVAMGQITGPMAALTLNTFEMTDKVILILSMFNNLKTELRYDGLWRYFDERMHGESHQGAWELAGPQLGLAGGRSSHQLEIQFTTLWEKWGPYVEPGGISKQYKEQVKSDLRDTVAMAVEESENALAEEKPSPSLFDKVLAQLANIKNVVADLTSKVNPFSAGPVVKLSAEARPPQTEEAADVGFPPASEPGIDKSQEDLDDLLEQADIESAENSSLPTLPIEPEPIETIEATTTELIVEEPEVSAGDEIMEVQPPLISEESYEVEPRKIELCQRGDAGVARQYRVLINEVAWMGNQDSPNDEWVELKNIWGIPVNLSGWQLLDKDRQIKVIFEEGKEISAGGYLLLERSKDYTGALNNANEALYLFDNNCQLEDEVSAIASWPGGDNDSKKTMQRFDVFSWYTGVVTAAAENSPPPAILAHPSAPAPASIASKPTYPKILITETQVSPTAERFVELYNPNDSEINLTGWYIQRRTGTGNSFNSFITSTQFKGKTILPYSYFLITRSGENADIILEEITLTESNTLVLKNPDRDIVNQVSTGNPPVSKSYGRQWSSTTLSYADTFESQIPTPKAQNQNSAPEVTVLSGVVINEIAWAGTKANSADEWIEIFNNTTSTIDLAGWKIKKGSEDWIVISTSTIPAQGYYLLERSDDNTIRNVSADQFFTGSLNNGGEKLELIDASGNAVDAVDALSGWFAGAASPNYISMERINATSSNWASNNRITINGLDSAGNPINGTPKAENSVSKEFTEVLGNRIFTEDFTLTRFGGPYIWQGSIIVEEGAEFTVETGVEIRFKNDGHSQFKVKGKLGAEGAVFTSFSEDQPWDGIYFENSTSTLNNVTVRYGGLLHQSCCYEYAPYTYGAIHIDGGKVTISNSLVEKSDTFGLWLENSATSQIINTEFRENLGSDYNGKKAAVLIENSSPTIKDSIFRNNSVGILAEDYSAPVIKNNQFIQNNTPIQISSLLADISDNTFQNNDINGVLVRGFGFSDSMQEINWNKINAPYFVDAALSVPSGYKLKIKPGVEIKFQGSAQIDIDGNLEAKGTAQDKITLTGAGESATTLRYFRFSASSTDSAMEDIIVKYGGYYDMWGGVRRGAIKIEGLSFVIKNSVFENNFLAVELLNADFAAQSRNISIQNNEVGIYVSAGGRPDLSNVVFGTGDDANTHNILP